MQIKPSNLFLFSTFPKSEFNKSNAKVKLDFKKSINFVCLILSTFKFFSLNNCFMSDTLPTNENSLQVQLLAKMQESELEEAIENKIKDFHGLLTKDAAMRILAIEHGLIKKQENTDDYIKIKQIKSEQRGINLKARINRIFDTTILPSGKKYRDMQINDESGPLKLRFWEDDVSFFSKIKIGDELQINNAYEKMGNLNLGYEGEVKIIHKVPFDKINALKEGAIANVKVEISRITGEENRSKNGSNFKVFIFDVKDETGQIPIVIWDHINRFAAIKEKDQLIIQSALFKGNELHVSSATRLLYKSSDIISGTLQELEAITDQGNEFLKIKIADKAIQMDRTNALKFFKINLSKDIKLATVVQIKKDHLINNSFSLKGKEQQDLFVFY